MFYKGKYFAPSERKRLPLGSMMMRLTAVLTCLVLLSFHLMGGMFAKYSSTATGSDSARVAKFEVSCEYDETAKSLTITNDSEVTVAYEVKYSFPVVLPEGVSVTFIYQGDKTIAPGDKAIVRWSFTDESNASGEYEIDIVVEVTQVD